MSKMSDEVVKSAWQILQAVYPSLPRRTSLEVEIADAQAAQKRGYYLPDEDERLRQIYARYLGSRATLWEMIHGLEPHLKSEDLRIFSLAFCSASILVRSATYLIEIAKGRPVVQSKLDEAEPRYGIPRKTLTQVYRSLASPETAWRYRQGRKFYDKHRTEINEVLRSSGLGELVTWLDQEEPYFVTRKKNLWNSMMGYRVHSLTRRTNSGYQKVMFHLFRMSGSAIAGRRQPFVKSKNSGKRITPGILAEIAPTLQPGDILITRHNDALSNLFLPGFWPHAALYLGSKKERETLQISCNSQDDFCVLEAKKDGVKLRPLSETLAVDAVLVLRPKVTRKELREILTRALTHEGKLYDFLFDFRTAERLACTEVIYRAFHGTGRWQLELVRQGGRLTLSAENLIKQSLGSDLAEVILIFGAEGCPLITGPEAALIFKESLGH